MSITLSDETKSRYPEYLKILNKLDLSGTEVTTSKQLENLTNIDATTIRRDFHMLGRLGIRGKGYDVKKLLDFIKTQLDLFNNETLLLIGNNSLPALIDKGLHIDQFTSVNKLTPNKYKIAIISEINSNSPISLQDIVDQLTAYGIQGFINTTSESIHFSKDVIVQTLDIYATVQAMQYKISLESKEV